MLIFWVVTPCSSVELYRRTFLEFCRTARRRIFAAMRTSNPVFKALPLIALEEGADAWLTSPRSVPMVVLMVTTVSPVVRSGRSEGEADSGYRRLSPGPSSRFCWTYNLHDISWNSQLLKNFLPIVEPKVHYLAHKSPPLISI